ncbi:MAG: sigma-70 family RNA polymerase sigma factor, partial [Eubacteriales bacterium]|nr:sigma-70 family RNA polymerase sigma factor [Eubacteriales bacterium]
MGKSPSVDEKTIQHKFDRMCRMVLHGERVDYYRHMKYRHEHEIMFSELSAQALSKLYRMDEYTLDHKRFQVLEYDIDVKDAL